MPKFADSTSDRRQTPRTKLSEIAYIGMGPENGGLVLDVSDGGLSFHAVAPVEPDTTVRFLLSLRGHSRIEGAGQVVWTNHMRTVCGLRFTSLSSGAREHLNDWTSRSRVPAAPPETPEAPPPPRVTPVEKPSVSGYPASPLGATAAPMFAIPPSQDVYLSEPAGRPAWRGPLFFWLAYGLLAAALIVTAFNYGVHIGRTEITALPRPTADAATQPKPFAVAPAPAPTASSPTEAPTPPAAAPSAPSGASSEPTGASPSQSGASSAPNVPAPTPNRTLVNASKTNDAATTKLQQPGTERQSTGALDQHAQQEAGKTELAAGLAYLNGENGPRNMSRAVQQLWQAVGSGNSEAEMILASLYIAGDGVAKNCEQARVLLMAAAKNGNVTAKVKLADLTTGGCR